ncbi:MAG: prolipoprotein diacylglyceryl transferase [Firmicutes bacterium]|nr:prolipoprotein diacylglyceryl transferase [Bacillota bacterium]
MYPVINLGFIGFYTYSLFLSVAFITCLMIFLVKNLRFSLRIFEMVQSIPLTFGLAFVGGNLLSFATVLPHILNEQLSGAEIFFSVGFVFYGALIGLLLGTFLESRRRKKPFLDYTDTFLRLLPLGQAIGRIGCYFNGCCYGVESDSVLAIPYIVDGAAVMVIPTQFIEAAFCLVLAIALLSWQTDKKGAYTFVYLGSYAVFRFVLEFFRGDVVRGVWFGFSTSQWIGAGVLVGLVCWVCWLKLERSRGNVC